MWSWLLAVPGRSWAWLLSGHVGSPEGSAGKESTCNAGDPGSIPVWRRSSGEGIGYPLQYSWTSLGAQLVKNLPAMQEIWLWSLGWEDLLEKGKATHSNILAWRNPWTVQSRGSQRVRHDWATFIFWASSLSWSSPALKILTGLLARNWHRCMNVCLCVCVYMHEQWVRQNKSHGKTSAASGLSSNTTFPLSSLLSAFLLLCFQITWPYLSSWVSLHHPIPYYLTGT